MEAKNQILLQGLDVEFLLELIRTCTREELDKSIEKYVQGHLTDKYVSIKKGANLLDIHPLTLREWGKQGKVRIHKINGVHRVRLSEIHAQMKPAYSWEEEEQK